MAASATAVPGIGSAAAGTAPLACLSASAIGRLARPQKRCLQQEQSGFVLLPEFGTWTVVEVAALGWGLLSVALVELKWPTDVAAAAVVVMVVVVADLVVRTLLLYLAVGLVVAIVVVLLGCECSHFTPNIFTLHNKCSLYK